MDNELVERLLDGELQQLREDLLPYKDKSIGWLRIDMGEVRKIIAAVDAFTEAATTITHLTEEVDAQAREIEAARFMAAALWALLDDIDTLDDAAKGDDAAFRGNARDIQRRRFAVMSGELFDQYHDKARALTGGPP